MHKKRGKNTKEFFRGGGGRFFAKEFRSFSELASRFFLQAE